MKLGLYMSINNTLKKGEIYMKLLCYVIFLVFFCPLPSLAKTDFLVSPQKSVDFYKREMPLHCEVNTFPNQAVSKIQVNLREISVFRRIEVAMAFLAGNGQVLGINVARAAGGLEDIMSAAYYDDRLRRQRVELRSEGRTLRLFVEPCFSGDDRFLEITLAHESPLVELKAWSIGEKRLPEVQDLPRRSLNELGGAFLEPVETVRVLGVGTNGMEERQFDVSFPEGGVRVNDSLWLLLPPCGQKIQGEAEIAVRRDGVDFELNVPISQSLTPVLDILPHDRIRAVRLHTSDGPPLDAGLALDIREGTAQTFPAFIADTCLPPISWEGFEREEDGSVVMDVPRRGKQARFVLPDMILPSRLIFEEPSRKISACIRRGDLVLPLEKLRLPVTSGKKDEAEIWNLRPFAEQSGPFFVELEARSPGVYRVGLPRIHGIHAYSGSPMLRFRTHGLSHEVPFDSQGNPPLRVTFDGTSTWKDMLDAVQVSPGYHVERAASEASLDEEQYEKVMHHRVNHLTQGSSITKYIRIILMSAIIFIFLCAFAIMCGNKGRYHSAACILLNKYKFNSISTYNKLKIFGLFSIVFIMLYFCIVFDYIRNLTSMILTRMRNHRFCRWCSIPGHRAATFFRTLRMRPGKGSIRSRFPPL